MKIKFSLKKKLYGLWKEKTVALICLEMTKVWGTSGWQKLF